MRQRYKADVTADRLANGVFLAQFTPGSNSQTYNGNPFTLYL